MFVERNREVSLSSILTETSLCQWKDPEATCGVRQGEWSKENAIPEVCASICCVYTINMKDVLFSFLILPNNWRSLLWYWRDPLCCSGGTVKYECLLALWQQMCQNRSVPLQGWCILQKKKKIKYSTLLNKLIQFFFPFITFHFSFHPLWLLFLVLSVSCCFRACHSMTVSGPQAPLPLLQCPSTRRTCPVSSHEQSSKRSPSLCLHWAILQRLFSSSSSSFSPLCKPRDPPAHRRKNLSRPLPHPTTLFKVPLAIRQQDTAAPCLCV